MLLAKIPMRPRKGSPWPSPAQILALKASSSPLKWSQPEDSEEDSPWKMKNYFLPRYLALWDSHAAHPTPRISMVGWVLQSPEALPLPRHFFHPWLSPTKKKAKWQGCQAVLTSAGKDSNCPSFRYRDKRFKVEGSYLPYPLQRAKLWGNTIPGLPFPHQCRDSQSLSEGSCVGSLTWPTRPLNKPCAPSSQEYIFGKACTCHEKNSFI